MKRMDVVKKNDQWRAESKGRAVPGTSARPVTVKIHKETGAIQEERTYPRKADPRKSKG